MYQGDISQLKNEIKVLKLLNSFFLPLLIVNTSLSESVPISWTSKNFKGWADNLLSFLMFDFIQTCLEYKSMSALNTENKQIKQNRSYYPICQEQLLLSAVSFLFVTLLRYFFSLACDRYEIFGQGGC